LLAFRNFPRQFCLTIPENRSFLQFPQPNDQAKGATPLPFEIRGLSKRYPNGVQALKSLNLAIGNNMSGQVSKVIAGYSPFEFVHYAQELYPVVFSQIMTFTLMVFCVQTIVSNKFIGHGIVIGVFLNPSSWTQPGSLTGSACIRTWFPTTTQT
jgi:hypothetical protein